MIDAITPVPPAPEQNVSPEAGFLFIGELSKETGADPKTIRFYERAALLAPPRHGRFRTYLAADVKRLKNILVLRKLGVPIARIRDMLAHAGDSSDVLESRHASALLRAHLDVLKAKQTEVARQIEQTTSALQRLAA